MKRSVDRLLTTHVGSLIRPPRLGEIGLPAATIEVVRRQLQAGIDVVNDGEFGKSSWANYALDRSGFEFRPIRSIRRGSGATASPSSWPPSFRVAPPACCGLRGWAAGSAALAEGARLASKELWG